MSEAQAAPKLPKWPFYLADLVLSGIAAYVLTRVSSFQDTTQVVIAVACLGAAGWAAWISIMPWLTEYHSRSAIAESSNLKSTLEQIQGLEKVGDLIRQANSQWQGVQDAAGRTVTAAREISDKMKLETDEFMKFIQNAHDQERAGLRLEVDKLRKMEGDWIKVSVQMLDHVFALFRAAERSGQEGLIQQLAQFQGACRDVARRMGLAPFIPALGEKYDARGHQLPNPPPVMDEEAIVAEILATGFTYQGQLLRRALVNIETRPAASITTSPVEAPAPEPPHAEVPMFAENSENPLGDSVEVEEQPGPVSPAAVPELPETGPSRKSRSPRDPGAQNELPLA